MMDNNITKRKNFSLERVKLSSNLWQEAILKYSVNHSTGKTPEYNTSSWNKRAENYAKNSADEKYREMQNKVFQFLEFYGVKLSELKILDLGCGPGNYTIPLAEKAAEVWALDPASSMLDILEARAKARKLNNIIYVNKGWEEICLNAEGWVGKFDLVFASMTPGINNPETLEKAMRASRNYCYLSHFAGERRNNLQEILWPRLSATAIPWANQSMDIIYPLNYLYALGYFPALSFINSHWVHNETTIKTTEKLLDWLSGFIDITVEIQEKVLAFVQEQEKEGLVREVGEANTGMIMWTV